MNRGLSMLSYYALTICEGQDQHLTALYTACNTISMKDTLHMTLMTLSIKESATNSCLGKSLASLALTRVKQLDSSEGKDGASDINFTIMSIIGYLIKFYEGFIDVESSKVQIL